MKIIKISFVNKHIEKNNINIDEYKTAINNFFHDSYTFEFIIDNSHEEDDTNWEEHGGISVIQGFSSNIEFDEIRKKLLGIYSSL